MPISGSANAYFYPVAQKTNSSFPSTDLRGVNPVPSVAGLGRLYVLSSSGDLRYVDPNGNDILVSSQTSEEVFNSLYVSSSLLVKGDTVLSGNVVVGGQLYDLNSNLILSSSVGSIIAASGSLDFPNTDKNYHIRAVNSHLILSSSVGSKIFVSGALTASDGIRSFGNITTTSTIFAATTNGGSVFARTTENANPYLAVGDGTNNFALGWNQRQVGLLSNVEIQWKSTTTGDGTGRANNDTGLYRFGGGMLAISGVVGGSSGITSAKAHLILSSSIGSVVALSSSQDFTEADKNYHATAVNSHLILSSSAGSIVKISGAFVPNQQAFATFPAGSDALSGGIVWDTTSKQLFRYGPNGWMALASGSNTL